MTCMYNVVYLQYRLQNLQYVALYPLLLLLLLLPLLYVGGCFIAVVAAAAALLRC